MDASKIRDAISGATLTIMIDTIMAVIGGAILYSQNSTLFFISLAILVIYGVLVFSFNKPLKDINEKTMEDNAQLTSYLVESLNGIETIKSFNSERISGVETEKKFVKLLRSIFKNGILNNASSSISQFISIVGTTVILWVGSILVIDGQITIGDLITFNALLVYFLDPVKNLINLQPMMQTAIVASDRLGEILDLKIEKSENEDRKIKPSALSGPIEFRDISFRYGTRKLVLENLSITVKKGEKIAFVGESGSGKTTLAKLLLNFYQAEKGELHIAGHDIRDINIEYLRDKIAYISQETFLFAGTIIDNLTLGMPEVDLEKVTNICKAVKIHDFINTLPLRYETHIEENGANMSGGQKQRLAIARALLKEPDILIMDEATSNLDSITEKAISDVLDKTLADMTTIIIAHRLSTIKKCDKIYVIDSGRVIEYGTHRELLLKKGAYNKLWTQQLPETEDIHG